MMNCARKAIRKSVSALAYIPARRSSVISALNAGRSTRPSATRSIPPPAWNQTPRADKFLLAKALQKLHILVINYSPAIRLASKIGNNRCPFSRWIGSIRLVVRKGEGKEQSAAKGDAGTSRDRQRLTF